jgi:hypothetical protein
MQTILDLWGLLGTLTPAQWATLGALLVAFRTATASLLSFVLGILGAKYPWALKAAVYFSDRGQRLHPQGLAVGSALLPGADSPKAAMRSAFPPRPSLLDLAEAQTQPDTLRTGDKPQ